MKSPVHILLLLAAAACLAPALPAQPPNSERLDPDDDAPLASPRHIAFGLDRDQVVVAMQGPPDEKLSPDIWVYWRFLVPRETRLRDFDALVIFFNGDGRVFKYRLMKPGIVRDFLADIRKTPTPTQPELLSESAAQTESDEQPPSLAPRRIGLGMTAADVVKAMHGPAPARLSPDIWVYWDFRLSDDPAPQKYDTLVVFFAQGRVERYRLAERKTVESWLREPAG